MNVRGCRPPNDPASAFSATDPAQLFCDQPIVFALAVLRCCGIDAASLDVADVRGGSFEPFSAPQAEPLNIREDATPVAFDQSRECVRGNRSARSRKILPFQALPPQFRRPSRVMHRRFL